MNEILFLLTVVISFSMVILCYRLFGKVGMFVWVALATVIANIEVVKCVDIFGLSTALGNVIYGSTFLCTDILSENHGEKSAKRAIWIGLFSSVASMIILQISLMFSPNSEDFANEAMHTVFGLVPRFTIVSVICYFISNRIDVWLFSWIGKHTKKVWVKNNAATMIAQSVDTILYTVGAFAGVFSFRAMVEICVTAYIMKVLVAALDTPFLYWSKRINRTLISKGIEKEKEVLQYE